MTRRKRDGDPLDDFAHCGLCGIAWTEGTYCPRCEAIVTASADEADAQVHGVLELRRGKQEEV